MRRSVNKITLIGNLGAAPELKYTKDNIAICTFNIATSYMDSGKNEITTWHRIVTFKGTAEAVANNLSKGSGVYVEGRLQSRTYEKEGVKKTIWEVIANQVLFLDKKTSDSNEIPLIPDDAPF